MTRRPRCSPAARRSRTRCARSTPTSCRSTRSRRRRRSSRPSRSSSPTAGRTAEIINVESEHSAMSAAIGAALAGARTMTATSSQGLALMAEVVYIAASMRAPIVMALGNRALSGPINIHCDHSDSMLIRDSGVVQLFAENAQEAYDLTVIAPRLAEHPDVLLPVLVCQDGFTITHSAEPVELLAGRRRRALRRRRTASRTRCSTSRGRRRRGRSRCPTTTSSCAASRRPRSNGPRACSTSLPTSSSCSPAAATARSRSTGSTDADDARSSRSAPPPERSRTSSTSCATPASRVGLLEIVSFRPFPAAAVAAALAHVDVRRRARPRRLARRRAAAARRGRRRALRQRLRRSAARSTGSAAATCIPADVRAVFAGAASRLHRTAR